MLKKIICILFIALPSLAHAQSSYMEDVLDYREGYKESLLHSSHPLKPEDTGYIRFYDVDPEYKVQAFFVIVTGTKPFAIKTEHGGTSKFVREYGYVYFNLLGAPLKLHIYRFIDMETKPGLSDNLFIPFTDHTNYKATFPGGRYLDLSINDIIDNKVIIDFNKCYNPHTAYEKGYPYIVPTSDNHLNVDIKAGEKIFGHNPGY